MQGDDVGFASTAITDPFWELWQLAEAHSANLGHHAGSTELFFAAGWWF